MPSYPHIQVRVTLKINFPPLSEGGQEKILCPVTPYLNEGNFAN
jgi:hypothetical protein